MANAPTHGKAPGNHPGPTPASPSLSRGGPIDDLARRYPLLAGTQSPSKLKQLPVDRLPELAEEVRRCICDQIMATGGHFASNLCVVELTIALHYVFDFLDDRLILDVGHQCYPHKLLTGRLPMFAGLKTRGGMAGFPQPLESDYDLFNVGHAGTAISCGVGLARGDSLRGEGHRRVVNVVGDASIVNGLAMEGLNDAGTLNRQFLTILNDNGRAIGDPQGGMAEYFERARVSHTFDEIKANAKRMVRDLPGSKLLGDLYHYGSDVLKAMVARDHLFEHLGHLCIGPVDGHDVEHLVELLSELKSVEKPVLLHVKTIKGKGYHLAEDDPFGFHAPKPQLFHDRLREKGLEVSDCSVVKVDQKKSGKSFTNAFSDALIDLMGEDPDIVAITAAMPDGTGLDKVMPRFPERTFDCGLAEGHGMDMAAGLAKAGLKPFFAVYSSFSQRALDQTFQEVALQGLPVRICMDRAGYVGGDGAAMHGFMDITMNKAFPDVVMLAPSDEPNFRAALRFMRDYNDAATLIRYPRDVVPSPEDQLADEGHLAPWRLGKAALVRGHRCPGRSGEQADLAVLAYGCMVYTAKAAIEMLEAEAGCELAVDLYDARFAKPVDIDLVQSLVGRGERVMTLEDHALAGGFGSCVLEACNDRGIDTRLLTRVGHPMRWLHHDSRSGQLAEAGLDVKGVARRIRELVDSADTGPEVVVRREVAADLRRKHIADEAHV